MIRNLHDCAFQLFTSFHEMGYNNIKPYNVTVTVVRSTMYFNGIICFTEQFVTVFLILVEHKIVFALHVFQWQFFIVAVTARSEQEKR